MQVLATALSRDEVNRCPVDAKAALLLEEDLVPLLLSLLAELPLLVQPPPAADRSPGPLPVCDPCSLLPRCACRSSMRAQPGLVHAFERAIAPRQPASGICS